jgi:coenzyme F420-reducing hydrogenase beta subunit
MNDTPRPGWWTCRICQPNVHDREEIIEILEEAATILVALRAVVYCDWCDGEIDTAVRDDEEVSWRRDQARTWCSPGCQAKRYDAEINAAGNEAS